MAETWTVTGQRATTALDGTGQFTPSVEVSFRTATGTVGRITVPVSQYKADHVRDLIDAWVAESDAIANL